MRPYGNTLCASLFLAASLTTAGAQRPHPNDSATAISANILLTIIRAEDERRWDGDLKSLLADKDMRVRRRAALAAGRIGDEHAVPELLELLRRDSNQDVRQMAVFALGEIESPASADTLMEVLRQSAADYGTARYLTARYGTARGSERVNVKSDNNGPVARPSGRSTVDASNEVRARALEALGKIAAALPESEKDRRHAYGGAILDALKFEAGRRSLPDRASVLLGLTAALRAKPEGAGPVITRFLGNRDARIRADAFNTLARLRLKDGNNEARDLLVKDSDAIVRANAARVLGATEDRAAFEALLNRALHDNDLRVRVSAIRALGALKDARAVGPLVARGSSLIQSEGLLQYSRNELLEITAALGRVLPNTSNEIAGAFLRKMHNLTNGEAIEVEVALARVVPGSFQSDSYKSELARTNVTWRQISRRAQGLASIKDVIVGAATDSAGDHALKEAQQELGNMLRNSSMPIFAVPDILQAYNSLKPNDISDLARNQLQSPDVTIRATSAEILGNQTPSETNTRALADALPHALRDRDLNDAALAILEALAKQKSSAANDAIKTALDSSDHLIRRKAVALLKANGAGDFSNRIGTVQTRNTESDYRRAIARIGKNVTATVDTSKGSFTIKFLPEEAPLTVDNFIQLARKDFFNGQTIPRVVPNFVVQAGDPRGDTNGGPGYQIRCEINEVPYERGAVGMALSGKDTGGSQWFVTHSPQPHLDGGYTVFGRVVSGMEVVDNIARGDIIRKVTISEQ